MKRTTLCTELCEAEVWNGWSRGKRQSVKSKEIVLNGRMQTRTVRYKWPRPSIYMHIFEKFNSITYCIWGINNSVWSLTCCLLYGHTGKKNTKTTAPFYIWPISIWGDSFRLICMRGYFIHSYEWFCICMN